MKLWRNANGIECCAPSRVMSSVVGEANSRADMVPPRRCADMHCGFILVDHIRLHHSRFEGGKLLL
jgi:hypothetical protein